MTGRILSIPQHVHQCSGQPNPKRLKPGTVWQCDDCEQQWVVVYGQGEDGKGYSAWRKLTEANRDGQDRF